MRERSQEREQCSAPTILVVGFPQAGSCFPLYVDRNSYPVGWGTLPCVLPLVLCQHVGALAGATAPGPLKTGLGDPAYLAHSIAM